MSYHFSFVHSAAMSISTVFLDSNLRFLSPPHSVATTAFIHRTTIRCGPRDSRGPLVKGRTLSTEAIQAVQYLKRLHRTTTTTTDLRSTAHKTLSRLIKTDLLAALRELLRQDNTTLALLALCVLNSEHGHSPDLSLYADVAAALSRTGKEEEIDRLVGELEIENSGLGLGLGFDEKDLVKLLKVVIGAGRRESTVRIYGMMRKNGWGGDTWKADDHVVKVLIKGFRKLGKEGLAKEIEGEFGGVHVYKSNK